MPEIVHKTPEERAKIAILKTGMQEMLEAVKKGLRFRIVTEEIEPTIVQADVDND